MKRGAWNSYSRYRTILRNGLWSVESESGEVVRVYPGKRWDRAQAFADKINSEEWMQAYFARRPKKKVKKKVA